MRRILWAVLVMIVIIWSSFYWLFLSVGKGQSFQLDIAELRRIAKSVPGEAAVEIRVEQIAMLTSPGSAIVAGDPLGSTKDIPIFSYQILFEEQSLILETALSPELAEELGAMFFDGEAYDRMQQAMLDAEYIIVTHEHSDHLGGVFYHPELSQLTNTLFLTAEQLKEPAAYAGLPSELFTIDEYTPLRFDNLFAVAPGIVLIKAPGHTPGSLMVYVSLRDGREFLFVGDIAWHFRNIEVERPKARIASQMILREEYEKVLGQIQALVKMRELEPELHIVVGHDAEQNHALIEEGDLQWKFESVLGNDINR